MSHTLGVEGAVQRAAGKAPIAHGADAWLVPGRPQWAGGTWRHRRCGLAVAQHLPQVAVGPAPSEWSPCTDTLHQKVRSASVRELWNRDTPVQQQGPEQRRLYS